MRPLFVAIFTPSKIVVLSVTVPPLKVWSDFESILGAFNKLISKRILMYFCIYFSEKTAEIYHNWCRLTLKCNGLVTGRRFVYQKAKLSQWGIKIKFFLRTESFIAITKIDGNLISDNSCTLRHFAVGLELIKNSLDMDQTINKIVSSKTSHFHM